MADATITLEARAAQTAERLLEMGEPKAAQDLLYAALSRAPSDVELLMPFARACQATGAEALMVQIFDRAVAETPDLPIYMAPDFFRRRSLARDRGIPSVLLITLGQCGSLYLRSLFEDGLDMPWCYVCAPGYLDGYLLPSWMQRIAGGGAVCNEHANPTEENVEILKRSGVRRMVLHDRDLRQSYISWCSHVLMAQGQFASVEEMRETDTFAAFLDENLERVVGQRAQWVNGWKDIAARHSDLDILFTHYEDMTDTPREFMNTLLEFYDIPADRYDFSLLKQKPVQGQKNYRKGERESWRSILNDDQLARIRDLA